MAKGQGRIQKESEKRSAEDRRLALEAQNRLREGSPEEQSRRALVSRRRGHITAGTVADAEDFASNRGRVADRQRNYEARQNIASTGIAGLAENYADPTMVALAKQANQDEFARDSAAQSEADFKDYVANTEAMENDVIQQRMNVESGIMGTAFGSSQNNLQLASQIAASRASILPSILGTAIGAGTQILTGTNWFQGGGGGAAGGGAGAAAAGSL